VEGLLNNGEGINTRQALGRPRLSLTETGNVVTMLFSQYLSAAATCVGGYKGKICQKLRRVALMYQRQGSVPIQLLHSGVWVTWWRELLVIWCHGFNSKGFLNLNAILMTASLWASGEKGCLFL